MQPIHCDKDDDFVINEFYESDKMRTANTVYISKINTVIT